MRNHQFAVSLSLIILASSACSKAHTPTPQPSQTPTTQRCATPEPMTDQAIQLPVPYIRQAAPDTPEHFAWTAALAMVSTYLGRPIAPCQIASLRSEVGYFCCHAPNGSNGAFVKDCRRKASANEISNIMRSLRLNAVGQERPLEEQEIQAELANHRPTLIAREDSIEINGQTHVSLRFSLISGYADGTYHVMDPGHQGRVTHETFTNLLHGPFKFSPWRYTWSCISTT